MSTRGIFSLALRNLRTMGEMDAHIYKADVLTRVEEIRSVAPDWEKLALRSGSPLLSADWFLACAETLCAESDLRIVIVRDEALLCAVAPLVVVRRDGIEWLEVLGVTVLYEPAGFLYDGVGSLRHLVKKIVSLRMPMVLARISAESLIEAMFREVAGFNWIIHSRRTARTAYLSTKGIWEDFFQKLSMSRRKRYRYQQKVMERFGKVRVRIERPRRRHDLSVILEQVFKVEGAGWKGRSGSALISNERIRGFFIKYSEMACDRGLLLTCFLDVNENPVATILGVEYAQRLWILKIGYDEQWAQGSPGIQLTMETIRYAFKQGLEGYEFLGSEELWQDIWPCSHRAFLTLALYPISSCGLRAFSRDLHRFVMRKIWRIFAMEIFPTKKYVSS